MALKLKMLLKKIKSIHLGTNDSFNFDYMKSCSHCQQKHTITLQIYGKISQISE